VGPERVNMEIKIGTQKLKQVQDYVYIGGTVSEGASAEQDIKQRIGLACRVMQNLNPLWKAKEVTKDPKENGIRICIGNSVFCNTTLETWTLKKPQSGKSKYLK